MTNRPTDVTPQGPPPPATLNGEQVSLDQARPEWSVARKVPRRWRITLTVLVLLVGAAVAVAGLVGRSRTKWEGPPNGESAGGEAVRAPVATICPKRDPNFRVSVPGLLATVEPFYVAHLRSRVPGVIKRVTKDIGDPVRRGELLVEIDVPDLEQDVALKEQVVEQRRQEVLVARSLAHSAAAKLEVARAESQQRQAAVLEAGSMLTLRQKSLARFRVMVGDTAVSPYVVDEQEQAAAAAAAAVNSAKAAVEKAHAEETEKEASLKAAEADVRLKEELVTVAKKDLDRARALADYARITAPFDGVVTRRTIDPGEFVQNASTGISAPLISVVRNDLVTITVKLPDNAAPFVTDQTVAELRLNDLPGLAIRAPVTRFAPAVEASDKTMQVEIDLFNGSDAAYRKFVANTVGAVLAPLGGAGLLDGLGSEAAGFFVAHRDQKGLRDRLPPRPVTADGRPLTRRLLPGMTGYVRLDLDQFTDARLLPSGAIFSRGGQSYILVVRDGVTRLVPVQVQVNDGRLAKVAVVTRTGGREVLSDLTGTEEVVASRQLEVGEGQAVRATMQKW